MAVKLNLGSGDLLLEGFINMDISLTGYGTGSSDKKVPKGTEIRGDWEAEKGLLEFQEGSIEAITISHMLYAIEEKYYPFFFGELYRVLEKGGIVRITDDNFDQPPGLYKEYNMDRSSQLTHTTRKMIRKYLEDVGFEAHDVSNQSTFYKDNTLIQSQHGGYTKTFHMEGIK